MYVFLIYPSEGVLEESEGIIIEFPPFASKNVYQLWEFRAPEGYVVEMAINQYHVGTREESHTNLFFGDNSTSFVQPPGSPSSWTALTNHNGHLKTEYERFSSESSSIKLVFSSLSVGSTFTVTLEAIRQFGMHSCEYYVINECPIVKYFRKCQPIFMQKLKRWNI